MSKEPQSETAKELAQLKRQCRRYELPFSSTLYQKAAEQVHLDLSAAEQPTWLAKDQYLTWFASDNVLLSLKEWTSLVINNDQMRNQLKNGFTTNEQTSSDTIHTLRLLCYHQRDQEQASASDAWEATAFFAMQLAVQNDHEGSPIHGMAKKGHLDWCFVVMIRLLITVYSDLLQKKRGYFQMLLDVPSVKHISK